MKTQSYNPSPLEVEFVNAISRLKSELESGLSQNSIIDIVIDMEKDNPSILIKTQDTDGDPHELVLKVIQRPDNF